MSPSHNNGDAFNEHHGVDIDSTSALWRRLCLAPLGHGAKNEAVRVARQTSTIRLQSNGQIATLDRGDFMLLRVAVLSLGICGARTDRSLRPLLAGNC
jgi:hypothetical protein